MGCGIEQDALPTDVSVLPSRERSGKIAHTLRGLAVSVAPRDQQKPGQCDDAEHEVSVA